ncbi:MAG: N-formylglutamate deformylase [Proteobacteria bacterium]|nr:N-formylglutamate deformylase [Pseudomonadota bacterium]MDA0994272.1 N-formylglutamate deformylase [Pseudomonadota bacterium]
MTDVFSFTTGSSPLLISIPHDGRELMPGQAERMTDDGRALPDTDWYVRELYAFVGELDANVIAANYSRYVVDLNRPADDASLYEGQVSTGLCPQRTFAGRPIYLDGETISTTEQQDRVDRFWRPYHDRIASTLSALRDEYGFALLWDAHSIASEVPMLFPGVLTDLNIGTFGGVSCGASCESSVMNVANTSDYTSVLNGRFKGGYTTRHYGAPKKNIHAIQLELSQRCYMDENNLSYDAKAAVNVGGTIEKMLTAYIQSAKGSG